MFCKQCGKELENGAKFCPNCGTCVDECVEVDEFATKEGEPKVWGVFAKLAKILGIVGFILSFVYLGVIATIPAIVFGILGKKSNKEENKKMAGTGVGLGIAGTIISFFALFAIIIIAALGEM